MGKFPSDGSTKMREMLFMQEKGDIFFAMFIKKVRENVAFSEIS